MKYSLPLQLPRSKGFSLMEMALVLMIVGILMGGVLVGVSQTAANAKRSAALAQLHEVEEALYGFAETQGRLPCPATVASKGFEDVTAGACSVAAGAIAAGFVPAATLGLFGQTDSNGLLVDSWNNPLRYTLTVTSVIVSGAGNPDFSKATATPTSDLSAIKNFFNAGTTIAAGNLLKVCSDSTCTGTVMTDISPAVVFSMGENWATSTATNEVENSNGDNIFVSTQYSEENFDDQIVWLSPYVLFNRMVTAGKLP